MTGKKKDHWSTLASMLGMGGRAAQPEPAEDVPENETQVTPEAVSPPATPLPPVQPPPPPRPVRREPPKPKATAKPAPKRRDHWGSVLGQLGLAAPPPEPEPEPEPAPAAAEDFVASTPPMPTLGKAEDDQPEGPPGYLGPDLESRSHVEREAPPRSSRREERPREDRPRQSRPREERSREDRPRGGGRRESGPPRPAHEPRQRTPHGRYEDDVEYDEELDLGLRELWASHEAGSPAAEDLADIEDVEFEDAELEAADIDEAELDEEPARSEPSKAESDEDDPSRPRRRRRRRRGRGRGEPREGAPRRPEILAVREPGDEEEEDVVDEEPAPSLEARQRRPEDEDEEGRRPKRRRRRRRAEPTHSLPPESDDEGDDDLEGPASVDYLGDADKGESHKRIPTWDDAVGAVVAANMEARSRQPHPPRGRDGRGRR